MSRVVALVAAGLLGLAVAGCGSRTTAADQERQGNGVNQSSHHSLTGHNRVLFDEPWVIEEGVWFIAAEDDYPAHGSRAVAGQANGLLGAGDRGALWVNTPAMYGKFAVRIELHDRKPSVPDWCEDVVEVSYSVGEKPLVMGSFESFSEPMDVPAGDYRVRYCVTGLDRAAEETAEDEFDGDDYRLYTGRHLLQLWPAAPAPDEVVRQGSEFAAAQVPG